MTKKHFEATAPDGTILRRSSENRTYSHCAAGKASNGTWRTAWASRYDLGLNQRDYLARCGFKEVVVLAATEITSEKATAARKAKVTDADRTATKASAALRKVGLHAKKHGGDVWVSLPFTPGVWAGPYKPNELNASPYMRQSRANRRIVRLIARSLARKAGFELDTHMCVILPK